MQADLDAVRSVVDQEVAMAVAGDPDAFIGQFTTDAMAMPPNEPAVSGEAFREWVRNFMEQFNVDAASYRDDNIVVDGDLAVHRYEFLWTLTPASGGETINEVAKGIHVLRRQPDGSWRISHDIWSSDLPLPQM